MGKKEKLSLRNNDDSFSDSDSQGTVKKSNNKKPKGKAMRFYNYQHEYEGEDVRKRIRALLKSFYGYTDDNNPFGDPELSMPFVWHSKIKKMRYNGLEPVLDSQTLLLKLKEAKKEIDSIIRSRKLREEMKDAMDAEKNRREDEKTREQEWREKDEKFHLAQENLRSEIRIMQGREKPIDFINKVLMIWKGFGAPPKDFFEIPEYQMPYKLFEILDENLLKELYEELKTRLQIDKERVANKSFVCFYIDIASNFKKQHDISESDLKDFIKYWKAMITIIESYVYPEKSIKNLSQEQIEQINTILEGKSFEELNELEEDMKSSLDEQISSVDIQFWSRALIVLQITRCKLILDGLYGEFKISFEEGKEKEEQMLAGETHAESFQNKGAQRWIEEGNLSPAMYESDEELRKVALCEHDYLIKLSETRKIVLAHQLAKWQRNLQESSRIARTAVNMKNVNLSKYVPYSEDEVMNNQNQEENSDEEAERFLNKIKKKEKSKMPNIPSNNANLVASSHSLQNKQITSGLNVKIHSNPSENIPGLGGVKASRFYLKEEVAYDFNLAHEIMQIENQELGDGEHIFNDVVPLSNLNYMWASKYKPRKPRYFNRVKTGYEWNKYNQVHYDYENPPPKVIQGYKFNIFFPDLIDKTKAPQYSLERSDSFDTCIIRFHAGPPYEDIAFKIVNREWDMTDKAGFRNVFDRGILYLYFNFKRYRYKR
jgi:hypothetical protein